MGKRIKLGLIFSYDEGWIGGTYYILNLINAFNTLPVEKKPEIIILSNKTEDFLIAKKSGYIFLNYINPYNLKKNLFEKIISLVFILFLKNNIYDKFLLKNKIDFLFPANNYSIYDLIKNKLYWIPDFQHIYFPDYFSKNDIKKRNDVIKKISHSKKTLILSSNTAKKHWNKIVTNNSCNVLVIPFAVTHPDIKSICIKSILLEFSISEKYFIISNQFWSHKNHNVVLNAALELKKKGINCQFIFTGKNDDIASNNMYLIINDFIVSNGLEKEILIIGFIDRNKQLILMKNAVAVIQPSFFEGWSTVIEDAKSLGKRVIASDITIHREQISFNVDFFNPNDHLELAVIIDLNLNKEPNLFNFNYSDNISKYANDFYNILT
jgi:glycosyltransferase involved in cell wall biosynthesis